MTDGVITGQTADLSLQDLNMNFSYHHSGKTLEFTDIQGTLLAGKPNHVEEYTISGDRIGFTDYSRDEAEFDVWIADKTRDIVRLAGKTRTAVNDNGAPYTNFIFNRSLSHFGDVHPAIFQFALKDWSQVEAFQLTFDFQLKALWPDLQRFSRTGLLFLSKGLLKEFNEIDNAAGDFKANIHYDPARSVLHYLLEGEDVEVGKREFKKLVFSGNKKDSLWSVEQMQLDDFSLAFDVLKEGPLWNINFLGAKLGDYLLIGMEGQYSDADAHLEARVNLFEADLAKLNSIPLLSSSFNLGAFTGQLRASGSLHVAFDKSIPNGVFLNAQMSGSLSQIKVKEIYLDDIKNFSFRFDTSKGFSISNLSTGIKSHDAAVKAGLFLQEASFDLANDELVIDGLHFNVPVENLAWAIQLLQGNFPEKFTGAVAEVVRSSKSQGTLQGSLRLSSSESFSSMRLRLNDGLYHFMGNEHDLRGLVIDYDPFSLKVFAEYLYKKRYLRLNAYSSAADFKAGEMILSDPSEMNASLAPLTIYWQIHPQAGYFIQKISGNLAGMSFDLMQDPNKPLSSDYISLIGKLDVNFRKARSLMDDEMAFKTAKLELGEGYSLAGQWSIMKTPSKSLADSVYFQGELSGKNFEFYGYRFQNLSSQFSCSPEAAYLRSLAVVDHCGNLQIEQMDFFHQGSGTWWLSAPVVSLREFRPNKLSATVIPLPRSAKSLVIRNLNIKDLKGFLGDRNSFTGQGQLNFANPPKKNLPNSFLAIPVELLTRLGLDLAVLTPVRGTVIFDLKDGKAFLNRFKDVYSKGRLSKFYLSNSAGISYVDFDGNLNLQVRMKQYNLFFKLAELFTFTVQGTLRKPTYTFLKQQKQEEVVNIR